MTGHLPVVVALGPVDRALVAGVLDGHCRFVPHPGGADLNVAVGAIVRADARADRALLDKAPALKVIARTGVGVELVDVPAATARGIAVVITPGAGTAAVAEGAIGMALHLVKRFGPLTTLVREGRWAQRTEVPVGDLGDATLGVVGYGRIGRRTAELGTAFGMRILAYDPVSEPPAGVRCTDLGDLARRSDVISLHLPLTAPTRHLVDDAFLGQVKRGAVLVNCSRGDLHRRRPRRAGRRPDRGAGPRAASESCTTTITSGRVRQDVMVVSGVPQEARGQGEPQPFTHLSVPNAGLYRSLLRTFAQARERFIVHLRPEDVAAELRADADEQLTQGLEQLVTWGNLRADVDTGRVTTVEDFHRKRSLYQLTAAGQAAEQAIAFYEEAIGRRGQLQSVALADIADQLRSLTVLTADRDPDPAKTHLLLLSVAERFTSLADNAQAFMSALRRAIDFSDGDVDGFLAYKERLIDYINRFIADLANAGAQIALLLSDLKTAGHERLLELAARREAADAVPEGPDAAESRARAEKQALDAWRNRWRGLDDWFTSRDAGHPSQARQLRQAAVTAIKQLIDAVGLLNERRSGRSDRSADFRVLARWFAEAPDDEAAHRLWRAAFGLCPARHLSVTSETVAAWHDLPPGMAWRDAPPIRISPQLRKTGTYERRGKPNQVRDRSAEREFLRRQAEREAAETAAARRRLGTAGPTLLSDLDVLDPRAFRLFLALLGDALAARKPGHTEVKTVTTDGTLEVRLSLVPDGGTATIRTADGLLTGPEHVIEITDLTAS